MKRTAEPLFLGIDIGTLDISALLVSAGGEVRARSHIPLRIRCEKPGYAEHDPVQDWWRNVCKVTRQLLADADVAPSRIEAVGVAGLFPVTCALDEKGAVLGRAILYSDSRAETHVPAATAMTGADLTGDEPVPNLLWLARHQPSLFSRIHTLLTSTGYLVYRLTGRRVIDPHNAYRFGGVVDGTGLQWREDVRTELGLSDTALPAIAPPGAIAGAISAAAAAETGLTAGTPVITGTTDTIATLLGNGVLDAGDAMIYYGTTGLLTLLTVPLAKALADPSLFGPDVPYYLAVYLPGSGAAVRWTLELLTALQESPMPPEKVYARLDATAATVAPGAGGIFFFPYMAGRLYPRPDGSARGHFAGLTLQHQAAHLWRSVLEAPGYVLAARLQQALPQPVRRLFASGGGARSSTWRSIVSNMLGLPQYYTPAGSGALGVAYLAAQASGAFPDLETIRSTWLGNREATAPDPDQHADYRRLLAEWQALDGALASFQKRQPATAEEERHYAHHLPVDEEQDG